MGEYIAIYVVSLIVALLLLYFIIKMAVHDGIKRYNESKYSGTDIEVRLTKLIAEIAKGNGTSHEKIDHILNDTPEGSVKDFLK